MTVRITLEALTRAELVAVARDGALVEIDEAVLARLEHQRRAIDALVESGTPVYGLSTGFGALATTFISPERRRDLQRSLIRSHAAGVGPEVEREVVRAMMTSRLTNLCSGVAGVRPSTALAYAASRVFGLVLPSGAIPMTAAVVTSFVVGNTVRKPVNTRATPVGTASAGSAATTSGSATTSGGA